MGTIALDMQAQALLKHVQRQTGPVQAGVEQALVAACDAQQGTALNADQLEKVLVEAMPAQKAVIQDSKAIAKGYHCDGKNGRFLTNILDLRIVKEEDHAYRPPAPAPPIRRDPLYASFTMAPDADFMLLFNARDVDRDGQPLLMKIVARERADITKIDMKRYRTQGGDPDVQKVPNDASYVTTQDVNETEFAFGDPLKQVSLDGKGGELSTSVKTRPVNEDVKNYYYAKTENGRYVPDKTRPYQVGQKTAGEQLDRTPVVRFDDRIHLSLKAKDTMPAGAWLDTPGTAAHLEAALSVERGFIFEPGSQGRITFLNATLTPAVAADDAHLLGSPASQASVALPNYTMRQVLSQQVSRTAHANPQQALDQQNASTAASDLIYANMASIGVGAAALVPLYDATLTRAGFANAKVKCEAHPACGDHDGDDTTVKLRLDDGFLSAKDGASVEGWKLVVGFTDAAGKWVEAKPRTVGGAAGNKREDFEFEVEDFDGLQQRNGNLEVRVFNDDGVPAQRVLIPFREIGWAPAN